MKKDRLPKRQYRAVRMQWDRHVEWLRRRGWELRMDGADAVLVRVGRFVQSYAPGGRLVHRPVPGGETTIRVPLKRLADPRYFGKMGL